LFKINPHLKLDKNKIDYPTKLSLEDIKNLSFKVANKSPKKLYSTHKEQGIYAVGLKSTSPTDDNSNSKEFININKKESLNLNKNKLGSLKFSQNKNSNLKNEFDYTSKLLRPAPSILINKENQ